MARIDDGYQILVSFAADATVEFYEKSVTPPGMDGGGSIDTTTMLNSTYRTFNAKALVTMSPMTMTCAYDPIVYDNVVNNLLNINNLITITWPDGATLAFWGWLNSFTPGECAEGEQPTADVEVIPSNQNASGAETAPVYTAP